MSIENLPGIKDEVDSILLSLAGSNQIAEWNSFVQGMQLIIIQKYDGCNLNTYKGIWKRLFKNGVEKLKLKLETNETDLWNAIVAKNLKEKKNDKSGDESPSTAIDAKSNINSATSSLNYQKELNENDRIALVERHKKLNNKWVLKSDRCVEDVIYEEAKSFLYEHPYHSYVISLDDNLNKIFTEEEVREMAAASGKEDLEAASSEDLNNILNKLEKNHSYREIENAFLPLRYSRIDHPEEHWIVKSILDYIEMFFETSSVRSFGSELTLFNEMYSFIKDSKIISGTTTEFAAGSKASCEGKNVNRSLSSTEKIARKIPGDIPDLVFKYGDNELGCIEIGFSDNGANGTKEINEKRIKTPKLMRSFSWKIMNDYEINNPRNIKVISYVISGAYLTTSIMTFKHGSVGLVYSSSRMKMPTTIKEIPRLLPRVLKHCYNVSQITKSTVEHLDDICSETLVDDEKDKFCFLPSFEPTNMTNNKRRKTSQPPLSPSA